MGKVIVGRPINGISINGIEYLLNDDGNEMEFENKEQAVAFLRENGYADYSDEMIEDSFIFKEKPIELMCSSICLEKYLENFTYGQVYFAYERNNNLILVHDDNDKCHLYALDSDFIKENFDVVTGYYY